MDQKLNVFAAINRRLEWLGQRQTVLAQNIANADTPDFRPRDLEEPSFARLLPAVRLVATDGGHITGRPAGRAAGEHEIKQSYETAPGGNAVVLEEELIKVAETQMAYQTMTNLYRKHLQMMRLALGRNG